MLGSVAISWRCEMMKTEENTNHEHNEDDDDDDDEDDDDNGWDNMTSI